MSQIEQLISQCDARYIAEGYMRICAVIFIPQSLIDLILLFYFNNKEIKRLISRTKKKLREIKILEYKRKSGVFLHLNQITKINGKDKLETKLKSIKNGTWKINNNKNNNNMAIHEKVRISIGRPSIDWTGKYAEKQIIDVAIDDTVRVTNGGTGMVKYFGSIDVLGHDKNVIGILMNELHPSYGDGTIDGKQYFHCNDGHGYFAHPPEIVENLGSIKPKKEKKTDKTDNKRIRNKKEKMDLRIGAHIKLMEGKTGFVKYIAKSSDINNTMKEDDDIVGIELDEWSINGNDGRNLFKTSKGRGYFARHSSIDNIILPNYNLITFNDLQSDDIQIKILNLIHQIQIIEKKIREIDILQQKQKKGEKLHSQQMEKIDIDRKIHLKEKLWSLKKNLLALAVKLKKRKREK